MKKKPKYDIKLLHVQDRNDKGGVDYFLRVELRVGGRLESHFEIQVDPGVIRATPQELR